MKACLLIAAVTLFGTSSFAAPTPDGLIGHYRSTTRKVCVANGPHGKPTCSRIHHTMTIRPSGLEGRRDVKVVAEFTLPDAQVCAFEGLGYWNGQERQLLVADARTGCELVLEPRRRELRAIEIRPEQCRSPCAGRIWLDGQVLRRD